MRAHRVAVESAALLLVGLGVAANEWLLVRLCSSDGVLAPPTKMLIRGFNVAAVSAGLLTLWFRVRISALLQQLSVRYGRSLAMGTLVSLATTTLLLTGAEVTCFFLNRQRALRDTVVPAQPPFHLKKDGVLGYKPRPNARISFTRTYGGQPVFNAVYSTDAHSRRVTPGQEGKTGEAVLLFFGDSFVFGEGVNDDETLPYHVGRAASGYTVYNYGYRGYGPHQMLARLEAGTLPGEVAAGRGIAIYLFNDAQVSRAVGSMGNYVGWSADDPYYTMEGGRVVRKGTFRTGRRWRNILYELFGRSQTLKYFSLDIPPYARLGDAVELTCAIIEASRDQFARQFSGGALHVLLYPGSGWAKVLIPMLQQRGIAYLDYSRFLTWDDRFRSNNPRFQIPHDGHPNAEAHRLLAARLVEDLGLAEQDPGRAATRTQ